MTEEKGSRLKSALGLDNLKGLGDTLKQIKEVTESLDEIQKTIGEVAKDNNPISRALAQTIEAQGLKALNEDNVNVAEEVRRTMAEELKDQEKTIGELAEENKGLREDKVVREVAETVKTELDKRLPQSGGGNGSGQGKLMDALEKVVADYMEKRLMGSDGEGTMTSEQIRNVIREEVAAVGGGNKKPEDMVEDLVNTLTMGDRLKEKLGIAGTGIGGRLLQDQGGNSGLRTDLVRALLEDERERLKITQDHETQVERNKHIGTLAGAVKDNLSDGISALTAAAQEARGGGSKPSEHPQVFSCGDCGTEFSAPPGWTGQPIKCACGRIYTKEELLA